MQGFVAVRQVTKRFGDVIAVDHADLEVGQGTLTALLGPSGCGKTTLLRLIGGLEAPDSGTIDVDGTTLSGPAAFVPPERRRIAMVFQDFALFPHMNVGKNVSFGLPRGARQDARTSELLELVGLGGLENRMPHELSGGQQQRVALARALAAEPRLILLDEPFSNLDPSIRALVRAEVRALIRQVGITAIFVTHDQDEALSLADEVAVMMAGRVVQVGNPREVYLDPATREVADFIGQPNFLGGTARDGRAMCELGEVVARGEPADGPVDVMVRLEQIVAAEDGVPAEVVDSTYYGREQVLVLRLSSGATARARWHSTVPLEPGDAVRVRVDGEVRVFPRI